MEKENSNPAISIIVPIYNVEQYLRKCVDSILSQTYRNLEIILVDDGSPDGCPKICDEYAEKDSRVKVIHKRNGGLSDARNAALDVATGEYIAFVDSDDSIVSKNSFKNLFNDYEELNNIIFLDNIYTGKEKMPSNFFSKKIITKKFLKNVRNSKYKYLAAWSFICKREFLLSNNLFFKKGILHEDNEWFSRLARIMYKSEKYILISSCPFYSYRISNESSIMNNQTEKNVNSRNVIIDEITKLAYEENDKFLVHFLITLAAQLQIRNLLFLFKNKNVNKNVINQILTRNFVLKKSYKLKYELIYFMTLFLRFWEHK